MQPGWPDWLEVKGQAMLLVFSLVGFPLLQSALCPRVWDLETPSLAREQTRFGEGA